MAPIKFEEQLKDKLEKRSLKPSQGSWQDLQKRLDAHDKRKRSTPIWWLGIAASIVGVILILSQLFRVSDTIDADPVIVDTETAKDAVSPTPEVETVSQELIVAEKEIDPELKPLENDDANTSKYQEQVTPQPKNETPVFKKVKESLVAEADKQQLPEATPLKTEDISIEDLKIQEVIAEIKSMQNSEVAVTNKEVDSLLKEAQREILRQKIFDNTTQTVNADALLQDVEVELEQSFRAKVFEALKSNFNSVKTAVAERNN